MNDAVVNAPMAGSSTNPDLKWYVVHAYSGMEKAVERNIIERIARSGMASKFGRILVPTEEVVEVKNGQKRTTERKFFPGYVLVEMVMDDETWHLVKHTNKVTGFVGGAKNRPAPISEADVQKIVSQMQEGTDKPRHKVEFEVGEYIRVKEGPFTDFNGTVEEVNYERNKMRVSVTILVARHLLSWSSVKSKRPDLAFFCLALTDSVPGNISESLTPGSPRSNGLER